LRVVPQTIGGPPANTGISSVRVGDLNGDGLRDIVTTNTTQHSLSVFLQQSPGVFPTTATQNVTSLLLRGPVDAVLLDMDGDGDSDIASANTVTNNITLALQSTPGSFAVVPALGLSASNP